MATLNTLGVDSLSLRGAGTEYNSLSRVFKTKAEADAALASGDWTPVAGRMNLCVTGDQGVLRVDDNGALVTADDATRAYIDAQVQSVVGDAPAVLDSLGELSDAMSDDPNFFSTMASANTTLQEAINTETSRATAAELALQNDVDANEADADAAIAAEETRATAAEAAEAARAAAAEAAIQADVDQNEADADAAIAAENTRAVAAEAAIQADVDANEAAQNADIAAEAARAGAAEAAIQADVDQNETDADAAIAAVQADVDANESDADTAIAAVQSDVDANEAAALAARNAIQADVDQNESDADTAIAAVQADVDANEAAALAARNAIQADVDANEAAALAGRNAIQADVDQNETDSDAAIAVERGRIDAILSGASADTDTFAEVVALVNSVDTANDAAFAGYVTSNDAAVAAVQSDVDANEAAALAGRNAIQADVDQNESDADSAIAAVQADVDQNEADADAAIAAVQADVNQNETDGDAADTALGVRIDDVESEIDTARTNLYSALGRSEAAQNMGTFTGSTLTDNTTVRALLQELESSTEARLPLAGGVLTGSLVVAKSFPDLHLKANDEKRVLFSDAGGGSTAAIKHVSSTLDFFAGGIAAGNKEMSIGTDGVDVSALKIAGTAVTATAAELNYVDGVTSNVQTQLDAIQADVNTNESDADTAIAAVQADVDQNESDADSAIAAVQADVDQNESDADAAIALKSDIAGPTFTGVPAAPTASAGTNTTQVATTAFVTTAVANVIDSAPGALDTLNELAAALGDDANFSTTITNAINANETHIDNAVTLTGVAKDAVNLGTFTGSTVSDSRNIKQALQELETKVEAVQTDVDGNESDADSAIAAVQADVDQNESDADTAIAANETHIDNMATLTGVAKDATHLATFTGGTIADNQTVKAALQALETKVEAVQTDVDGNESDADTAIALKANAADSALTGVTSMEDLDVASGKITFNTSSNVLVTSGITASTAAGGSGILTVAGAANLTAGCTVSNSALNVTGGFSIGGVAVTSSAAELNYVDGVTSNVQTQLDAIQADVDGNESDADTAIAANETHIDNMATLTGVAKDATNVGTFTGSTISDNGTIKAGIQELETAVETKLSAETITMTAFKAVVAASSDFGDFQSRVASL